MNARFKSTVTFLLTLIALTAGVFACSDDRPALEGETPTAMASDMQPQVEVLQSDRKFIEIRSTDLGAKQNRVGKDELIKIAESMPIFGGAAAPTSAQTEADILVSTLGFVKVGFGGTNLDDVYPSGLHESCISQGPGYPPAASKKEIGSLPLPAYLPEGVSLDQESFAPDGTRIGNIYAAKGGVNSGVRITVRHGTCESVNLPAPRNDSDSWELTPVAGSWGIFFQERSGGLTLNLTLETETGFIEIRSTDLGAKQNRVGKDELIKIAESMPIFGGADVSAKARP